jgi:hypothetical protein
MGMSKIGVGKRFLLSCNQEQGDAYIAEKASRGRLEL